MKFTERSVLIFGDIILDNYIYGNAIRLSPEAPVPVVDVQREECRLGGAANVAANIASLGGTAVLVGITGFDADANDLYNLLHTAGIRTEHVISTGTATIRKTRVIANRQQVARLDYERPLSPVITPEITMEWREAAKDAGAIVISDYNKGFITRDSINIIVRIADEYDIPLFIDPKIPNAHLYYGHVDGLIDCMTPNLQEAAGLAALQSIEWTNTDMLARNLLVKYGCRNVLVTCGEHGMVLCSATQFGNPRTVSEIPSAARQVFDVSGAGDTVIGVLALAYASGITMQAAAELANTAAGIVVGKAGTATVTLEELCTAE